MPSSPSCLLPPPTASSGGSGSVCSASSEVFEQDPGCPRHRIFDLAGLRHPSGTGPQSVQLVGSVASLHFEAELATAGDGLTRRSSWPERHLRVRWDSFPRPCLGHSLPFRQEAL